MTDDRWAGVPLFGCCSYENPVSHKNECFPWFFPEALLVPCLMFGANVTLMTAEPPWSYDFCRSQPIGDYGCFAVICSAFASLCIWWPFSPLFCLLVCHQRNAIRKQYFPNEPQEGRMKDICIGGLCAPCGVYQHHEFLRLKHYEALTPPQQQIM
jgi:hypothetical protein